MVRRGVPTPIFLGTPLHTAVSRGSVEIVKALIEAGANIEAEGMGKAHPLHIAALRNQAAVASLLISKGAQVDARDKEDMTPLLIAAASGSAEVAAVLLEAGADPLGVTARRRFTVRRARYITLESIAPISDDPIVTMPAVAA